MAKKLEVMAKKLNGDFGATLDIAVKKKLGIEVITNFNIFQMQLMTSRSDSKPLTAQQGEWISAFSDGYLAAMTIVEDSV